MLNVKCLQTSIFNIVLEMKKGKRIEKERKREVESFFQLKTSQVILFNVVYPHEHLI